MLVESMLSEPFARNKIGGSAPAQTNSRNIRTWKRRGLKNASEQSLKPLWRLQQIADALSATMRLLQGTHTQMNGRKNPEGEHAKEKAGFLSNI
jgi:hypothetical protein